MKRAWHLEVAPRRHDDDPLARSVESELKWLGLNHLTTCSTAKAYLFETDAADSAIQHLVETLFVDLVVQKYRLDLLPGPTPDDPHAVIVCRKPGVMDPPVESIRRGAERMGVRLFEVRTGTIYRFPHATRAELEKIGEKLLANAVVDEILVGKHHLPSRREPEPYRFKKIDVPLPKGAALLELSKNLGLALNQKEMEAVAAHFKKLGRDPSDLELETIAQTWSEHCKHKTFGAIVEMDGKKIDHLLKSTIFRATKELDRDFCVSVFKDNAGIVRFDDRYNLCFKVETHNHPSAIEPYGGAGTGLGGVIRDILGTGLGAKPIANIDVFCLGRPDMKADDVPTGALHPLRVLKGVVSGVRDYGNRMGIPTVAGGLFFDDRYTGNPLVFCGTIGLIPRDRCDKKTIPGDKIVALGGRTGRDGIHGATFSSMELTEKSDQLDGGAVQIGNAITEKRMMDVLLTARDRGLYRNVTDCGAGGFSSAIGEMGAETGARVDLENAPLKYPGLSYREIWISEAQERMVLAVPPEKLDDLLELAKSEDVEACVLGEFTATGRLEVSYGGKKVADLDMHFLHDGLPRPVLSAEWKAPTPEADSDQKYMLHADAILAILASPNVASKEWIIRQYDHEVQGQSCIRSLVGDRLEGPGDASVLTPVLGSTRGFAVGMGANPLYGDLDPYDMACAAIDEAVRNVVAVGGDPDQTAILDNFSWGNCAKPDRLGALVRASMGCYDAAKALRTPFISGKDSLNNEFKTATGTIVIPHTLLVSSLAIVPDVDKTTTMDLKKSGSRVYLVGVTKEEMGGSHYMLVHGRRGRVAPKLDLSLAPKIHAALHRAVARGIVLSCHDLSEGGLAVAAAEMAFSGGVGMSIELSAMPVERKDLDDTARLFSESLTRYLVEVAPEEAEAFENAMAGLPCAAIGRTTTEPALKIADTSGKESLTIDLERLRWAYRFGLEQHLEKNRG